MVQALWVRFALFMCYDTGLFGFVSDEDPFIVDGDGVLEIYEDYIGE